MKKRDFIVIVAVIALALGIWGAYALFSPGGGEYMVIVYVGGKEYARETLKDNLIITVIQEEGSVYVSGKEVGDSAPEEGPGSVTQQGGSVNVVEISKAGVRMQSASCENQLCVHQGWVLAGNALGDLGGWIICLPNRVSVELRGGDG